ncbi:unnamed protein product [Didymodactylos carnosus]|uniref:Ras-GEF domain-containing protein n=1 Tax=Didymodactylos carnosus TaxID=1234261 RepID=A0A8S2DRP4_9BILA|nr:unnamed protein product [Didymodactylos carnosus]CAF3783715.1 unnamed protein product [Didymodactylos carnosus]
MLNETLSTPTVVSRISQKPSSSISLSSASLRRFNWSHSSLHLKSKRISVHENLNKLVFNLRSSVNNIGNINAKNVLIQKKNAEKLNGHQLYLLCEEKQDDAIYRIYLKRVRQRVDSDEIQLTSDSLSTTPVDGSLLYHTVKVVQLKAGTLAKIVEYLTNDRGELDSTHMHTLFATYRSFTDPLTLCEEIIQRYESIVPATLDMTEGIRQKNLKSIRLALGCLLTTYKEDFLDPPRYTCLRRLLDFSKAINDHELKKQCQTLLDKFIEEEDRKSGTITEDSFSSMKYSEADGELYGIHGYDYLMPWEFVDIPNSLFAEQLTYVDAELLKRVIPYECLNIDKRSLSKIHHQQLSTVAATIDHFNAVVGRVMATILKDISLSQPKRAQIIEKWIDIAQECRNLKNFSSLTAILNGLSSCCVHRLQFTWQFVSKSKMIIFDELRTVFGSCADRKQARQILNKTMIGTVPYLGLYLSDLTYIDSAFPNQIEHLINFEKRRKEFEILAQLKLFQSAANSYRIMPIKRFKQWFDNVRTYTDSESWQLSYQVEPQSEEKDLHTEQQQQQQDQVNGNGKPPHLRRPPSVASLDSLAHSSSIRSSPSSMSLDKMSTNSTNSLPRNTLRTVAPSHSRSSSASSFLTSGSSSSAATDECIIAKVQLASQADLLYKCIRILNNERTSSDHENPPQKNV